MKRAGYRQSNTRLTSACACAMAVLAIVLCLFKNSMAENQKIRLVWQRPVVPSQYSEACMAIHDNEIYCNNARLSIKTGNIKHIFRTETMLGAGIEIIGFAAGTIIFAAKNYFDEEEENPGCEFSWHAFDLRTNRLLWTTANAITGHFFNVRTKTRPDAILAVCGDTALLVKGDEQEQLEALNARTGKTIWLKHDMAVYDMVAENDRVFITTNDNKAIALSLADGKLIWQAKLLGDRIEKISLGKKLIYIPCSRSENEESLLTALDKETGKQVWKKTFSKTNLFPAAVSDDMLCITEQPVADFKPGSFLALDAVNGQEKWKYEITADYNGHDFQPVITEDKVIIWSGDPEYMRKNGSSGDISMLCLNRYDGKLIWKYKPPEKEKYIYSRLIVCGKYIFFNDTEDVYCIKSGI